MKKRLMQKILEKIYDKITKYVDRVGDFYISVKKLPKYKNDEKIALNYGSIAQNDDVAIIIQGPLLIEDEFTINTVKLYKKIFCGAEIIVSTWKNQDTKQIESLKSLDVQVLELEPLENRGCANINAQLYSSRKGIEHVCNSKVKYILKTRSDQRIYYPNTFGYLKGLLNMFPSNSEEGVVQKKRIIVTDNIGNYDYRLPPFFIIDYLYFGTKEDMTQLMNIPFNSSTFKDCSDAAKQMGIDREMDFFEQCKYKIPPEYYICTQYLSSIGVKGNYEDDLFYLRCIKRYFLFISPVDIDLYWPKYNAKYKQPNNWIIDDDMVLHETYNMNFQNYIFLTTIKDDS